MWSSWLDWVYSRKLEYFPRKLTEGEQAEFEATGHLEETEDITQRFLPPPSLPYSSLAAIRAAAEAHANRNNALFLSTTNAVSAGGTSPAEESPARARTARFGELASDDTDEEDIAGLSSAPVYSAEHAADLRALGLAGGDLGSDEEEESEVLGWKGLKGEEVRRSLSGAGEGEMEAFVQSAAVLDLELEGMKSVVSSIKQNSGSGGEGGEREGEKGKRYPVRALANTVRGIGEQQQEQQGVKRQQRKQHNSKLLRRRRHHSSIQRRFSTHTLANTHTTINAASARAVNTNQQQQPSMHRAETVATGRGQLALNTNTHTNTGTHTDTGTDANTQHYSLWKGVGARARARKIGVSGALANAVPSSRLLMHAPSACLDIQHTRTLFSGSFGQGTTRGYTAYLQQGTPAPWYQIGAEKARRSLSRKVASGAPRRGIRVQQLFNSALRLGARRVRWML